MEKAGVGAGNRAWVCCGDNNVLNCFTNSLAPHPTPLLPVLDCKRLLYVCVTLKVEPAALCMVNKYSFTELHPQTLVLGTQNFQACVAVTCI